ncbi:hypothetical protein [Chitinophaga eiseniae]|uniref:Uncharacterized protein n=1 Tax=Chitinophaga eiseniae TaxID=634771 RepID=A0A847SCZ0_9BACT|nr:hypothetical protein [Chitinophaga eiseniae]NLR78034.1 hypothetical protein [Chitinophaga eiseniae]
MAELPVINVCGDLMAIDVKDNCIYSFMNPENRLSFSQMQYMPGACTYRFMYDQASLSFISKNDKIWPFSKTSGLIEIPPKVVLDPYTALRLPKGMLKEEEFNYPVVNAECFYSRIIPKVYISDTEEYFLDTVNGLLIGEGMNRPIEFKNAPPQVEVNLSRNIPSGNILWTRVALSFEDISRIDPHGTAILTAGYERYYEAISKKGTLLESKVRYRNGEKGDEQSRSLKR